MKQQWILWAAIMLLLGSMEIMGQSSEDSSSYSGSSEEVCLRSGEVFTTCGTACPATCSNYNETGRICTLQCVKGCFCDKGLVRRANGNCVPPSQCGTCGVNEEYTECGLACEDTCTNFYKQNRPCPRICKQGCKCKSGYARSSSGLCVEYEQCPIPKCPANAQFNTCGPKCEQTCGNAGIYISCIQGCAVGCFCNPGYYKTLNGSCVSIENCPVQETRCAQYQNEHLVQCQNLCGKKCSNYFSNRPVACPDICAVGCDCNSGYIRNDNGTCVKPQDCPGICGWNEVFDCGSACDTECSTLGQVCPIVNVKCNEKCYCRKGFARNSYNQCIPISQCPPKKPRCVPRPPLY